MRAWIVIVAMIAGCSKSEGYKSNFASVRLEDGKILDAKSSAPYSGTLIARDRDIGAVARETLGGTYARMSGTDLTGLVLVMPVDKGVPSGRAAVYVDFNAPRLNPEIARRSDEALAVARVASGTIKLAEATFKDGKLDGTATVYGPSSTGMTRVGEVQFKDHVLHGTALEFYPGQKQVKRELHFVNGVQVGPYKSFHANGKLWSEGTYVANAPDGDFAEYYANGAPHVKGKLENGQVVSYEAWYPSGQKQARKTGETLERWYSNGQSADGPANGVIEEFHDSGELRSRTTFVDGVRHGRHQEWWKNGKPALDATYASNQLDGDYKRWYANGKEWESAKYVAGQLDGPYRKWWKNGKPAHVYAYKAGKLDGDYQQNYDNGAKWVRAKYAAGKPQGAIERWFRDGTLGYVMNHKNGRPDGPYKRWWANGKPRLVATHVDGALDGDFKNWLEDGTLYEQATYTRGVKTQTTRAQTQP